MAELVQTPANVGGTITETIIAGEAIDAGMPIYRDAAASNKAKKSRANAVGTALCDGIAINSAGVDQPLSIQRGGSIDLGATLTVGTIYVVSDATAGKIMPSDDLGSTDYPVVLGVATAVDSMKMGITAAGVPKP